MYIIYNRQWKHKLLQEKMQQDYSMINGVIQNMALTNIVENLMMDGAIIEDLLNKHQTYFLVQYFF